MKKIGQIGALVYCAASIGIVVWVYGFPKSFGKFLSKWQEKLEEGMED